jgi:hypothetical protein
VTPADARALRVLAAACEGSLPPPANESEAHIRRALRWLDLLDVDPAGQDEHTARARRRMEGVAALVLEDLGEALRQTTSRGDGGPAGEPRAAPS